MFFFQFIHYPFFCLIYHFKIIFIYKTIYNNWKWIYFYILIIIFKY